MTGKTHTAVSAAVVSVLLALSQTPERHSSAASAQSMHGAFALVTYSALLLVGVLAGLFPDLDAPNSTLQILPERASRVMARHVRAVGRKRSLSTAAAQASLSLALHAISLLLLGTSALLRTFTHHRGFTHTIWCALATTMLAVLLALPATASAQLSMEVGAVWLTGYASHLAADACTPSGIPLFGNRKVTSTRRTHSAGISEIRVRLQSWHNLAKHRDAAFHLLPKNMRVTTGTFTDTVIVRWLSWSIFVVTAAVLVTGTI